MVYLLLPFRSSPSPRSAFIVNGMQKYPSHVPHPPHLFGNLFMRFQLCPVSYVLGALVTSSCVIKTGRRSQRERSGVFVGGCKLSYLLGCPVRTLLDGISFFFFFILCYSFHFERVLELRKAAKIIQRVPIYPSLNFSLRLTSYTVLIKIKKAFSLFSY